MKKNVYNYWSISIFFFQLPITVSRFRKSLQTVARFLTILTSLHSWVSFKLKFFKSIIVINICKQVFTYRYLNYKLQITNLKLKLNISIKYLDNDWLRIKKLFYVAQFFTVNF